MYPRHQVAVRFLSSNFTRRRATVEVTIIATAGRSCHQRERYEGYGRASTRTTATTVNPLVHSLINNEHSHHLLSVQRHFSEKRSSTQPPQKQRQRGRHPLDAQGSARTRYDHIRRMIVAASDVDNNNSNNKNELHRYPAASLRHSYDFLLSAAARNVASQKKEHPAFRLDLAKKLLDHVIQTAATPEELTQFVIGSDLRQGINYGFGRLICQYLEPLRGTAKSLHLAGQYTKAVPLADQQHALHQASQVADCMQQFFKSEDYTQLVPNVEYYEILCTLWSRRCRFLAQTNLHNDFSALQRQSSRSQSVKNRSCAHEREEQQTQDSFQQLVETGLGGAQTVQDCVEHVRSCLDEMESLGISPDDERVRIHELTCLANSGVPGASEQAIQVFEHIQENATKSFIPTLVGTVLLAFANELPVAANSHALFGRAVEFWKSVQDRDIEYAHDPIAYSILMRMASQAGNGSQAEVWLEDMERLNIQPSTIHYNIVLTALTNGSKIPNIQHIEEIFRRMETMAQAGRDTAPDKFTCTTIIKALLRSYEPKERALAVLTMMERSKDTRLRAESPVYTEYMSGLKERFLRAQELHDKETIAIQMEEILRRMQQRTRVDPNLDGPNRYHLNSCLEIWSRSYSKLAPTRVKQLFADFCKQNIIVQPDGHTFRLILKALAIGANHESINYAQGLLDRMKQEGLAEHIGVFNQYLHMLVKCRDRDSLEKAEKFVLQMEDDYQNGTSSVCPNGATYSIVLKEYSKQAGKEKQAELWFARMLRLQEDGDRADIVVIPDNYATVITVWAKSKQGRYALKRAEALFAQAKNAGPPTRNLYSAYQDAWSRLDRRNAPMRLEKILKEMQQHYESGVNPHCRPDASNFSILIGAWAAVGNMERAEGILNHMEELARSSVAYKHLKPTVGCYRGVIQACMRRSNEGRTSHAVRILDRMEDGQHSKNGVAPLPDESCFLYAILSVVKDGGPQAARRALLLLQRMNDPERNVHISPSYKTYSMLFRACAATTGSPDVKAGAFEISKSILQDYFRKAGKPNEDVLLNFKHAAAKLLPADQCSSPQIEDALRDVIHNPA